MITELMAIVPLRFFFSELASRCQTIPRRAACFFTTLECQYSIIYYSYEVRPGSLRNPPKIPRSAAIHYFVLDGNHWHATLGSPQKRAVWLPRLPNVPLVQSTRNGRVYFLFSEYSLVLYFQDSSSRFFYMAFQKSALLYPCKSLWVSHAVLSTRVPLYADRLWKATGRKGENKFALFDGTQSIAERLNVEMVLRSSLIVGFAIMC